jgi:diguanylate cyclase (GGDEF)-like protein
MSKLRFPGANVESRIASRLAVVVGSIISAVIFLVAYQWENTLSDFKFNQAAQQQKQTLNADLRYAIDQLYTLSAFYEKLDRAPSRSEFQAFAQDVRSRLPGLRDTGYAERVTRADRDAFVRAHRADGFPDFEIWERGRDGGRVPAADRAEYWVVLYADPAQLTSKTLGFDLASDPVRADAIHRAIASGRAAATTPMNLVTYGNGFMAYAPVFRKTSADAGSGRLPEGVMLGVFETAAMISDILGPERTTAALDAAFFATDAAAGTRAFYSYAKRPAKPGAPLPELANLASERHWRGAVQLADQRWDAVFTPSDPELSLASHWQSLTVLLAGATVTAISALYLRRILLAKERIAYLARHDVLTGLVNRSEFAERVKICLAQPNETAAVLCVDLDFFKIVNDTLGHPVGDQLLREVAARMSEVCDPGDCVARLGGDEFAVLRVGGPQPERSSSLSKQLVETLSRPFAIDGHAITIGASVGVALIPDDGREIDTLMRKGDMALYRAKAQGKNQSCFFSAEMDLAWQARGQLEADLRQALARGEFVLHYQPLSGLEADRIHAVEALIHWHHPQRGRVQPAVFLPLAEELGLIRAIGAWAVRRACADASRWPGAIEVAVNVSAEQFKRGDLVELVESACRDSGLDPSRLQLEIAEAALLTDADRVLATLRGLRAIGARIVLDNFGTGYSSLNYLRQFPFDKLKIDKSFVDGIEADGNGYAILENVAKLAAQLGIRTTAEGIETAEQRNVVRSMGYDEIQGRLVGTPKSASEIAAMLARRSGEPGLAA